MSNLHKGGRPLRDLFDVGALQLANILATIVHSFRISLNRYTAEEFQKVADLVHRVLAHTQAQSYLYRSSILLEATWQRLEGDELPLCLW